MQVTSTGGGCDWYAQLLKVLRRSLMQAPVDVLTTASHDFVGLY